MANYTQASSERDLKASLSDLEDKYKKLQAAHKLTEDELRVARYEVDSLKDRIEDVTSNLYETTRLYKQKHSELQVTRQSLSERESECARLSAQLRERDSIMQAAGLVFYAPGTPAPSTGSDSAPPGQMLMILSTGVADALEATPGDCLDEKLGAWLREKLELRDRIRVLNELVESARGIDSPSAGRRTSQIGLSKGSSDAMADLQRDTLKQLTDYKLKLQKLQDELVFQEQASGRLDAQCKRQKAVLSEMEKSEEELKTERRRLQKDLRDAIAERDELRSTRDTLQKRLDKALSRNT